MIYPCKSRSYSVPLSPDGHISVNSPVSEAPLKRCVKRSSVTLLTHVYPLRLCYGCDSLKNLILDENCSPTNMCALPIYPVKCPGKRYSCRRSCEQPTVYAQVSQSV